MRRGQRDRVHLALEIPFGRRGHRRAARAVIGDDLALALRLDQREAVAADAGRLRLDHAEQRAGRHRGVGGGAAGAHHLDRRQRGQRMRRRHHRVLGVDRRPAGEMEIPHAKLLTSAVVLHAFPAGIGAAPTWHIQTALGNGGDAMGAMLLKVIPRKPDGIVSVDRLPALLINLRHAVQGRRLLSVRRAAGFPGAARAAARALRRLGLKGSVLLAHEGINGTLAGGGRVPSASWSSELRTATCSAAGSTISS